MLSLTITTLALLGSALAQRPANLSICDYYTTALLKNNTAENQYTLLTLVVNTAVIGNYTQPNVGIAVPGILAPGEYNGTAVNLLPYFDGGLASTNGGGSSGVSMNFLDDGGAAPLMKNMPAYGTSSNQYMLLTHLYQFFGVLLGCSLEGNGNAFPAYGGDASMYETHKFMDLNPAQLGYFITQVGLSAASFGVAADDVMAVGTALAKLFAYKCSPPTTVVPAQGAQLQAICVADACPLAPQATCAAYDANITAPAVANATLAGGNGTAQGSNSTSSTVGTQGSSATMATGGTMTATASVAVSTGGAVKVVGSVVAIGLALAAFGL